MERLKDKFLDIYYKELSDLSIGYSYNPERQAYLKRILNILFYLKSTYVRPEEAIKFIELIIQ